MRGEKSGDDFVVVDDAVDLLWYAGWRDQGYCEDVEAAARRVRSLELDVVRDSDREDRGAVVVVMPAGSMDWSEEAMMIDPW